MGHLHVDFFSINVLERFWELSDNLKKKTFFSSLVGFKNAIYNTWDVQNMCLLITYVIGKAPGQQ